jgi:hypothetical protein
VTAKFDLATLDGKRRAATFFADLLIAIEEPVVRDATLARAAAAIGVAAPAIVQLLETLQKKPARAGQLATPLGPPGGGRSPASPARKKALRDVLDVCLNMPSIVEERHVKRLPELLVDESEQVRDLLQSVCHRAWIDPEATPGAIMSVVEDETFRKLLGDLIRDDDEPKDLRPQLEGAFGYLENGLLEREIHTLADTVMLTGSDDALRLLSEAKLRADALRRRAGAGTEGQT